MCAKIVQTYQQTFNNDQANVNRQTFKFQRIYKTKPDQYFRLKLTTLKTTNVALYSSESGKIVADAVVGTQNTTNSVISSYNFNTQNLEVFLTGIPELTGRCNCQTISDNTTNPITQTQTNDFYLGTLFDTGMYQCPEMILQQIPLEPFTIYINANTGTTLLPTFVGKFIVSFIIELLED